MTDEEKKIFNKIKYDNEYLYCDKKDVDCLIDIIEKQYRQIEGLIEVSKECIEEKFNNDQKWKDKIKAKIEEYDDKGMTINLTNRSAGKTFQQALRTEVKKILQSLLEKE